MIIQHCTFHLDRVIIVKNCGAGNPGTHTTDAAGAYEYKVKRDSLNKRELDLIGLLNQTTETIFRARQKELKQYNISTSQGAVLFITKTLGEKATISEISRWLLRKPHTISEIVKRMANKGLVKKSKVPNRKTIIKVELTQEGLDIYQKAKKRQSFQNILSCLSQDERQQLISYLQRLREVALNEIRAQDEVDFPTHYF